ncbi:MAG: hypothetical protein ACO1QB_19355 [Verrucomicrobiales bacterium]
MTRFTIDGSELLEKKLEVICEKAAVRLVDVLPAGKLELLLLAGGYGRGEGGVLKTNSEDAPYNDLEFYVFLSGNRILNQKRLGQSIHHLGEELTTELGIEVEFKIASLKELEASPVTMFTYDLLQGHKTFAGSEQLLDGCQHHLAAHRIPLHECARLLMNRCSGLLFAQERLSRNKFSAEEADFVRRNIAKAQLAMGDVLLAALGHYHWSCRERNRRLLKLEPLTTLSTLDAIQVEHQAGVEFKLHPFQSNEPQAALMEEHARVKRLAEQLWLWLEERRLKKSFKTVGDYAVDRASKCPETSKAKNLLINAARFGPKTALTRERATYPRERLLRALPLLLWAAPAIQKVETIHFLQKQLMTSATSFNQLVEAYENLWRQYN